MKAQLIALLLATTSSYSSWAIPMTNNDNQNPNANTNNIIINDEINHNEDYVNTLPPSLITQVSHYLSLPDRLRLFQSSRSLNTPEDYPHIEQNHIRRTHALSTLFERLKQVCEKRVIDPLLASESPSKILRVQMVNNNDIRCYELLFQHLRSPFNFVDTLEVELVWLEVENVVNIERFWNTIAKRVLSDERERRIKNIVFTVDLNTDAEGMVHYTSIFNILSQWNNRADHIRVAFRSDSMDYPEDPMAVDPAAEPVSLEEWVSIEERKHRLWNAVYKYLHRQSGVSRFENENAIVRIPRQFRSFELGICIDQVIDMNATYYNNLQQLLVSPSSSIESFKFQEYFCPTMSRLDVDKSVEFIRYGIVGGLVPSSNNVVSPSPNLRKISIDTENEFIQPRFIASINKLVCSPYLESIHLNTAAFIDEIPATTFTECLLSRQTNTTGRFLPLKELGITVGSWGTAYLGNTTGLGNILSTLTVIQHDTHHSFLSDLNTLRITLLGRDIHLSQQFYTLLQTQLPSLTTLDIIFRHVIAQSFYVLNVGDELESVADITLSAIQNSPASEQLKHLSIEFPWLTPMTNGRWLTTLESLPNLTSLKARLRSDAHEEQKALISLKSASDTLKHIEIESMFVPMPNVQKWVLKNFGKFSNRFVNMTWIGDRQ